MLYIVVLLIILLAAMSYIVIDSIAYYFRLKSELVEALTQACIHQSDDPELLRTLVDRRTILNDEQLVYQINGWLRSREPGFSFETRRIAQHQYASLW